MILTNEQIAEITNESGVYDCRLITQLFAYSLFADKVSPLGDIVCFQSPVEIGPLSIDNALVFAAELPNVTKFGSVCFQRLYATQLGSLLSVLTSREYYVDESSLFCDISQASLAIGSKVKESGVFNMIFPIAMTKDKERFLMLDLSDGLMGDFTYNAIESFRYLTNNIFVETCRDNF